MAHSIYWKDLTVDQQKQRLRDQSEIGIGGCWNWTKQIGQCGYGVLTFKRKTMSAHRLSQQLFNGNIPDGKYVCHNCDNRKCINPDHLYLDDCAGNMRRAAELNRMVHKLTLGQVSQIRELHRDGSTQMQLAKQFNVGQDHISRIVNFKRRIHV